MSSGGSSSDGALQGSGPARELSDLGTLQVCPAVGDGEPLSSCGRGLWRQGRL